MARNSNLFRRDGTYYARIYIPKDLQPDFGGKAEKWQSLRTKESHEAKPRLASVLDQWAGIFADMRRSKTLTDTDMQHAAWEHYSAELAAGDKDRLERPTQAQIDEAFDKALEQAERTGATEAGPRAMMSAMFDVEMLAGRSKMDAFRRKQRLAKLKVDLIAGDTRLIEPNTDAFLKRQRFRLDKAEPAYRELCLRLMRAEIEALQRTTERDGGDFTGQPKDPLIAEPMRQAEPIGASAETIMQLFARYEKANPRKMQADSMKQVRRDVEHFAAFVGPRFRPEKIDRATVAQWMDVLYEYPVKASEIAAFKGMTPQEAVAANKALTKPRSTLSTNTIRRYMSSLGGFCRWLKLRSILNDNPVSDMLPEKDRSNGRKSFTLDAMQTLLTSPLFTGCQGESWQDMVVPGRHQIRDHRYWVPLVMAYSGARPGEIAQLQNADVRQHHGIWIMHITELGEGEKRTKTESSMRVVPIHSELIRLGFVEHCKVMVKAGHKQVFPEVRIPEVGQIIPEFSREMNRTYLPRIGLKKDRSIVVYSLRHTVVDRLRLAGVSEDEIGMLVGHDKPTMTKRYGVEQPGTLKRRAELVEMLQY